MHVETFHPYNGAGWRLELSRTIDPRHVRDDYRPVLIVPGYGMNSFIFGFHPNGPSMIEALAARGFEVWTVNFRNQTGTVREGGNIDYDIGDIALTDLPVAVDCVLENRRTKPDRVDLIGCSLGGTYVYAYAALVQPNPIGAIVGLGGPLRWVNVHPVLRLAFSSPALLAKIPFKYTRQMARYALPLAAKVPGLLHIYLHPKIIDLSRTDLLVQTVEDPNPVLNAQIARWVINRDLILNGRNVTEAFRRVDNPLFVIQANADGIVPRETALDVVHQSGAAIADSLVVGTEKIRLAHADMYISNFAQELVFAPLSQWLAARQDEQTQ